MRILLVPLSFKESLVYCQRTSLPLARKTPRLDDRLVQKAADFWTQWQKSDAQWKKKIVGWADKALARISYDEWSLKAIPAKTAILRKAVKSDGHVGVEELKKENIEVERIVVEYAPSLQGPEQVRARLRQLAEKGIRHHRKYMWLSAIGAPLTLPVAAIPVIPNLPGFYLLYRAWSHWKALDGAKHLDFLIKEDHFEFEPNQTLEDIVGKRENQGEKDHLLLAENQIKALTERLDLKNLEPELVRAVRQVKHRIDAESAKEEQQATQEGSKGEKQS